MKNIRNMLDKILFGRQQSRLIEGESSLAITDQSIINSFIENPDFPFLVSFPRTGSHWLRMLMELYFEKPALVRAFYYKDGTDFTCYHHHDEELKVERRNVLYLYRAPIPTIFSQMNYYKEDLNDEGRVIYWSDLYGRHLNKWLICEQFTVKKTVLRYEYLKSDITTEFKKICSHFGDSCREERLATVSKEVSKEKLKEKTAHDHQVVNLSADYTVAREEFRRNCEKVITDTILKVNRHIEAFF